eukprot:Plantae.Rhodophyta-Hildenbrandia_rubra.ctg41846.p1 GENE.Plantae.Rhodophyta-Hildenbrandia_rubra.ctg41846~~Plantae.Rhodophyta-Hildenbrandia_rubra.ctg41846.p1  ORF type:complete len:366 (-),score=68.54 Plantae.Rhodophyta-Hildenbrandia_rubra.ctg41846:85-1182(-)
MAQEANGKTDENAFNLKGIQLALGSYDAEVSGLSLWDDEEGLLSMEARYAYRPHADCVTCLCFDGNALASGSADETVRVYDVASRREGVTLMGHTGSINEVQWARDDSGSYLLTAGEDGDVGVWRRKDWRRVKELRGSGSPVTGMAVHPSSKVVLSVGKDGKLNMWDLAKGRIAFSAKLKVETEGMCKIQWTPNGELYALAWGNFVTIYEASGKLVRTLAHDREVVAFGFMNEREVVTGGDDKKIRVWDVRSREKGLVCATHDHGVRGLVAISDFVVSGDSHGGLKVWDRRRGSLRIETKFGHGMRLTCMAAVDPADVYANETSEIAPDIGPAKTNCKSAERKRPLPGDTASKRKRRKRKSQLEG